MRASARATIEKMVMTPFRQRMFDALQVCGMAVRTQQAYIDAVARLARHYPRSPDPLSAHEVQQYLLHLRRERGLSCSTLITSTAAPSRFFYGKVLERDGGPSRSR